MSTDIIIKKNDFACPVQIKEFLEVLDFVYDDVSTGQHEMLDVFMDFEGLVEKVEDNEYIKEYVDVQVGRKPITQEETHLVEIEDVCAKRMGIRKDTYRNRLDKNIRDLAEYSANNVKIAYSCLNEDNMKERVKQNTLANQDIYNRVKYLNTKRKPRKRSKELVALIEHRDSLQEELHALQPQKDKIDKGQVTDAQMMQKVTKRHKELVSLIISHTKNINEQRRSLGESIGNNNQRSKQEKISFDEVYEEVSDAQRENALAIRTEQVYNARHKRQLHQIKQIASKVLTRRQHLIFIMYYIDEMTQDEIAEVYNVTQPTIHEIIGRATTKIQKSFFGAQR